MSIEFAAASGDEVRQIAAKMCPIARLHSQVVFGENPQIRLFLALACPLDRTWAQENRVSSYWRLYFNDEPGSIIKSAGGLIPIPAHRICLIPAGCHYSYYLEIGVESINRHFYVHFDVPGVAGFTLREAYNRPVILPDSPPLTSLATSLSQTQDLTSLESRLALLGLTAQSLASGLACLDAAQRERALQLGAGHHDILPALRHIDSHLHEPLNNEALASLCHLSHDHFIRRFREATRRPPMTYVRERRVALAAQQLLFSEDTLEKIAHDTGLTNRHYLTRVFTQSMGVAPATFRKNRPLY